MTTLCPLPGCGKALGWSGQRLVKNQVSVIRGLLPHLESAQVWLENMTPERTAGIQAFGLEPVDMLKQAVLLLETGTRWEKVFHGAAHGSPTAIAQEPSVRGLAAWVRSSNALREIMQKTLTGWDAWVDSRYSTPIPP